MTKLQMRELRGSDTFKILRLINKVGVAEMVKDFFGKNKDSADNLVELKGHLTKKPTKKELEAAEGLSSEERGVWLRFTRDRYGKVATNRE